MISRTMFGGLAGAVAIGAALAPGAGAAPAHHARHLRHRKAAAAAATPSPGGCLLQGTASFTKGLNLSTNKFDYSFTGSLTDCQSAASGAPATGTVTANEPITVGGATYQEPTASGSGGCESSTTSGVALAKWADGTATVINYSTTGYGAAVELSGTVVPSMTLTLVSGPTGSPSTVTIATTRYTVGQSAGGVLAFQPPDPTACNTTTGVTTAGISGGIGIEG